MAKLSCEDLAAEIARHSNQPLRKSGNGSYMLRCPHPEHRDSSPSFHVFQDRRDGRGRYKCHATGCAINGAFGKGGDSIDWQSFVHGKSYVEITGGKYIAAMPDPGRERALAREVTWRELRDRQPDLPDEARLFVEPESLRDRLLRVLHKDDNRILEQKQRLGRRM